MTAEEKNRILKMKREGLSVREAAAITGRGTGTIGRLFKLADLINDYAECPNCGKEIVHYKVKGRKRVYCCEECKRTNKVRRNTKYTCLNCGKTYYSYRHHKSKFCSFSCYIEHRYGKRLQKESS